MQVGYQPPAILNYIVAYDGDSIDAAVGWVKAKPDRASNDIDWCDDGKRVSTPSPGIDGIIILKKGTIMFDNLPLTFVKNEVRRLNPQSRWVARKESSNNLLLLFLNITSCTSGTSINVFNPLPYLKQYSAEYVVF